jgi:hypothetical protein
MKLCRTCNTEKDKSEFHKRSASTDGLCAKCKSCQKQYDKSRANLPHRVEARRAYSQTPQGKEAHNRSHKKWKENNAIKRGANVIVGNAVRDGKLFKPDWCSKCGEGGDIVIQGHHDDYAKPLEVTWLCAQCHTDWHNQNGEGLNGS